MLWKKWMSHIRLATKQQQRINEDEIVSVWEQKIQTQILNKYVNDWFIISLYLPFSSPFSKWQNMNRYFIFGFFPQIFFFLKKRFQWVLDGHAFVYGSNWKPILKKNNEMWTLNSSGHCGWVDHIFCLFFFFFFFLKNKDTKCNEEPKKMEKKSSQPYRTN